MKKAVLISMSIVVITNFTMTLAAIAASPNLEILRDGICTHETLNVRYPEQYIGPDGELGRCAIMPATARWAGYRGTPWMLLTDEDTNRRVALMIIEKLYRTKRDERGMRSILVVSYHYNGGQNSRYRAKPAAWRYAKQRALDFARAVMPTTKMRLAKR